MTALNKQQKKASAPTGGVELLIAGAGTGKTKTLVEKVSNIIKVLSYQPESILILTFSRKAAAEIKERIKIKVGPEAEKIISGTFHSFCLNFLRSNQEIFKKNFSFEKFPSVLREEQKKIILNSIFENQLSNFKGLPISVIEKLIFKIDDLSKESKNKLAKADLLDNFYEVINFFSQEKKRLNLIDYNDMINFTINLLTENKKLREKTQSKFNYLLVDEFQDTSTKNFALLNLLLSPKKMNLFAVGDDWQSIYGFRKAQVEYIVKMKKFFPKVVIHKLDLNYRSRTEIVELSNKFIKKNKFRTNKKLTSAKGKGGQIYFHHLNSPKEEPALLEKIISQEKASKDLAILYRNNRQGEILEKNLNLSELNLSEVNFMTMHASKGLEFETIIISGVADHIIPDKTSNLEEERRLFYVALSRAKEKIHIISYLNKNKTLPLFTKELGFSLTT